ncbi:MAG: glycine cleavage system aminomethyltransferase GcvT [Celeribacter sp.]|jgi:aminomethyltransferase
MADSQTTDQNPDQTPDQGDDALNVTPLFDFAQRHGGKIVDFAGWALPVQFAPGVMKEHLHTRAAAGLFDVSHMGQVILRHPDGATGAARALERLVPADLIGLKEGRQRYGLFTNAQGGILDDLMIANRGDHLFLVVNAANRAGDLAHLRANLPDCEVEEITDRALIALQGPQAEAALAQLVPDVAAMKFMDVAVKDSDFGPLWISRSGYTGEDGYEISVGVEDADALASALVAQEGVAPVGLGARDSLRLEAGLCLHGHDIDTTTTPVEAALVWAMQKVRRPGGARAGGYPGAEQIAAQLETGPERLRVGLLPGTRAPMREGTQLFADAESDTPVGQVTSGAFGPSIGVPMSMGYLRAELCQIGTAIYGEVRGKRLPVTVADMPFRPATYKR